MERRHRRRAPRSPPGRVTRRTRTPTRRTGPSPRDSMMASGISPTIRECRPPVHRRPRVRRGDARRAARGEGRTGRGLRPLCRRDGRERVEELAADGLRVIAVASRGRCTTDDLDDGARDLTLRGLIALADGVVIYHRARDRAAGPPACGVLVATGDHPETASAIAAQAGVPRRGPGCHWGGSPRLGPERTRMVQETAVFARLSPEQKVGLVAALRRAGATMAMPGSTTPRRSGRGIGVGVGGAGGAENAVARRSADLSLPTPTSRASSMPWPRAARCGRAGRGRRARR